MRCLRLLFPAVNSYRLVASTTERLHNIKFSVSVIEFLAFWLCDRTQVIRHYIPPLNFRVCSLDKTHHVVQNPSSVFIDERKTRKEVTFSGFNFSDLITV